MWLYRKLRHKICEFSSVIYSPINRLILTLYGAKVGKKLNAFGLLHIYNVGGEITLGDHVTINSAPWANPIGGGYMTQFQIIGKGSIRIGNNTGISNCAITSAEQVSIGNNVLIGSGVRIFDTDFHPVDSDGRLANDFSKISTAPVAIGNNVFIGSSAIILKGVNIGDNSVVGAGSVVTKDIGPNEIWGGNPAKRIRSL